MNSRSMAAVMARTIASTPRMRHWTHAQGRALARPAHQEESIMTDSGQHASPFRAIQAIDYTLILVRDWGKMRHFYQEILGCPLLRELSPAWIEYQIGSNTLALAEPKRLARDLPTPQGSASLQLAFKVSYADVDRCAAELIQKGVRLLEPPTDQSFGHRTLFFRDPDGNLLEVFAEI
jgi:lactoylglutathione lyase